ncbi:MAG: hypothetical protein CFH06_01509 [Alphaproteobacteria bacterium MarineAlpha3_Bin5]|nr:MAG: hypothetical protein CFH06_01509 [Alphaproteobacteria bacterium MarineAlpha3_Bin5]|tara:strand:+ start:1433 stop:1555 length:123 start_codon:yes stop_codon:yes gene_type:complete
MGRQQMPSAMGKKSSAEGKSINIATKNHGGFPLVIQDSHV